MTRKELAIVAGAVALAEAILLFCIPAFWHAGASMGDVVGSVILSTHWIFGFVAWTMAFFLLIMLVIVGALIVILGYLAIVALLQKITSNLKDLANQFDAFSTKLSQNARDAAIDAGFMGVLGITAALVAYLSTEDFLANIAVLKVLAAAAMCYAALKAAMLIPIRATQILSAVLIVGIFAASIALLHHKHPLYPFSYPGGVVQWFLKAELTRSMAAYATILLSALAVFYPFTRSGWKRILNLK